MENLHLAIILDGNRRFAKKLRENPWEGHNYGAGVLEELFDWLKEFNIRKITLYCLSLENLKRTEKEVDYLIKLFKKKMSKLEKDRRLEKEKIKIKFIGKTSVFDKELQDLMHRLEEKTKGNENYLVNFAIAYSGRQEIIEAVKKLKESGKEVNEENFGNCLWLADSPDLIIRTGGEKRTSNFLPWQSVYSEWIFLDKLWPEFEKEDLRNCIKEFRNRKRRFGR